MNSLLTERPIQTNRIELIFEKVVVNVNARVAPVFFLFLLQHNTANRRIVQIQCWLAIRFMNGKTKPIYEIRRRHFWFNEQFFERTEEHFG